MMTILFTALLSLVIGVFAGYQWAHKDVAAECTRLGGFYVNKQTFKCTEITSVPEKNTSREK